MLRHAHANNSSRCFPRACTRVIALCPCALFIGCGGVQSSLKPAGVQAELIAELFWIMSGGAVAIWLAVIGFAVYATLIRPKPQRAELAQMLIVGGGIVVPVIVLAGLLLHGLALMPELRPPLSAANIRIDVSGEQWWWRVRYRLPDGETVTLANEIRLPVGKSAAFHLTSPDVIHSFWIPALGGKVDMTPGRTTTLVLTPKKTGTYRGACAEYCGASHARMNFLAVVMAPDEFAQWLSHQATDAVSPADPLALRGEQAFLANGCGACHAIRGTPASGEVGPDLTHIGSRLRLAAGTLPNEPAARLAWIREPGSFKPDVHMPAFGMLPAEELRAIAAYLGSLE